MNFRRLKILLTITWICLFTAGSLYSLTIKIGSIAPARSPWDKAIKKLGRDWARITNGKVRIKIYAGGIAGSEDDMIRKIRMGILGGAALTNRGMTNIYPDVYVLNIPLMIESDEELNFVFNKMRPLFEKQIEEKGFKVVIWSLSGWINLFTKKPVLYPKDLRKHKISFATGEPRMEQAWKIAGFQVIPNEIKDLMMALQSGMVDSFYLPPLMAASGQYFPLAPNMCSLKIAPLLGGIVLSDKVWKRVPEEYKQAMLEATRKVSEELYKEVIKLEKEAIDEMKKHKLVINRVPDEAMPQWRATIDKGMGALIGKAFSKEVYDLLRNYLKEFRSSKHGN